MRIQFYATMFGIPTCVYPQYGPATRLLSRRGAFADVLASGTRPALLVNHDARLPLDAWKLDIWEDEKGLAVDAEVADDAVSALAARATRLGRCNGGSYGFTGLAETRYDPRWRCWVREIYRVDELRDVSILLADATPAVYETRDYVEVRN